MIDKSAKSASSTTAGRGKRRLRRLLKCLWVVCCLWVLVSVVVWGLGKTAITQISELTGAKVSAKSVRVQLNGHVRISGLSVSPYQRKNYRNTILHAQQVDARFSPVSFLLLRPKLREITIEHFVFDAQYDMDTGLWNIGELNLRFPAGSGNSHVPAVNLAYGMLQYSKVTCDEIQTVAAIPVDASFVPADANIGGYEFRITTAEHTRFGKSTLTGNWRAGVVTLAGGAASADIAAFERVWAIGAMRI